MEQYLFILFGGLMLVSGAMTIIANNPVHSVFYLIFVFVNASAMLILLDVEFLAITFLIVYVGAVSILFLFVVMMFNIKLVELKENTTRFIPIGMVIAVVFLWQSTALLENFSNLSTVSTDPWFINNINLSSLIPYWIDWSVSIIYSTNIEIIGQALYTDYAFYFLLAGCILLLAMIGAIVLSLDHQKDVRRQSLYAQVATSSQSRFYSTSY